MESVGTIKKSYSQSVRISVIILILIATSFFPAELFASTVVFCGLLVLFISNARIKISLANVIIPLLIILLIGLIGVFHHEPLHIFRDIAYALTPIALLITGYWIAENSRMRITFFRILLLCGFIIAAVHIFKFILDPKLLTQDIASMRLNARNPNVDLVSIALIIGLFRKKLKLDSLFPRLLPWYVVIPILIISFVLSFSRTGLVILFVMTVAITGLIGKLNIKSFLIFLLVVITFTVIVLTTPRDDVETFRGKIARSVREVMVKEYKSYKDITINWRGYETWLAMNAYKSGTTWQKIGGQGFGAVVDLNMNMTLAEEEFTEIPILHNGYAYILVKTGILGLLCYAVLYLNLLYRSRSLGSKNNEKIIMCRLLIGSTISLMLTMFVIGGMAEIHNSEYVLLVGFALRRLDQIESGDDI